MTPVDLWSSDMLINLGFAGFALSFLVRDILWLRLLAIVSYVLFCTVAFTRADGPDWNYLAWYGAFIAINVGHAAYLIYERALVRLNDEECRLRDLAFPSLDPIAVKRILRAGTWLTLPPGELLTREGRISKRMVLIAEGEATIVAKDREITRSSAGRFVGEIGFLAASGATATALVSPDGERRPLRCLAWNAHKLRKRLARDEAMRSAIYAAIGMDLSAKIAEDNVKVMRPAGAEPAAAKPA